MYKAVFCIICAHLIGALIATESEQRSCTEYLEGGNNGSISSPGFPDNYPNNVNYTRIINVKNTKSRVNFTVLYLEAETDGNLSCFDYLKIERLDVFPCCYTLFKGCRNQTNSIEAEGKQFRVSFISDSSSTRKGFLLYWKANASVESERYYTENLNSSSGQLTSPEYPCNYPNNVNYTWTIQTGNDYVNFTILELDAEVRTHGEWFCVDYLKIEEMDPCCITVTEGCRAEMYDIVVKGGQFRVSFISEYSHNGRGFRLNWQGANVSTLAAGTGFTILSLKVLHN
ncbi:embryonic protein UVS.2-like isoform X2 [Crassostrea virginica]